jgi:hypothetical protein
MNELINNNPDINVKESEYKRLLGYPYNYEIEGRARELADWARQWYIENGNPWIYALKIDDIDLSNQILKINNIEFSSKRLHSQFEKAGVSSAMLAAVSAGKECEEKARQLWLEGKPDEYFFLEVFGSAVVEHLVTTTGFRFCDWAEQNNMGVLPHYSPGYTGWNVEDQNKMFLLISEKKNYVLPGEIDVLETGMLKPKKSMLALFGITEHADKVQNLKELIPCKSCSLVLCRYRREPYRYPRTQIEDVHRLEPNTSIEPSNGNGYNTLTQNAKYSINNTALQKWSQERLQLKVLEDSSVEACFRYEGTTCSNTGHRLEFDYMIKLSPPSDGYKITGLNCNPANGDHGYTYMCEYIRDPETLMSRIENEKPLFGKSLNDVLSWKRQFNPEGCYCNSESRNHKWGLAFEVLHYALVKRTEKVLP